MLVGFEFGEDRNSTQNYTRNIPAIRTTTFARSRSPLRLYAPAGRIPEVTGNLVTAKATDVAPYINDTMSFTDTWKAVAGVRYDTLRREPHQLDQPPASASQAWTSRASARA